MSRTSSEQKYSSKTYFETRRENQDFGRQNNSMTRPTLESTPLSTNTTNRTTSPIDSNPVGTKTPEPTTLTIPTKFREKNKNHMCQGNRIQTHHCQTHH